MELYKKVLSEISAFGSLPFYGFVIIYSAFFTTMAVKLTTALIISQLVIILIRYLFYKPRPNARKHKNFLEKLDAASFPSGHAARVIILIIFGFQIPLPFFLLVINLLIGLMVLLARIVLKEHYAFDITIGGLIGAFSYLIL